MSLRLHDTLCTDAEEQRLGVPVTAETWERARPRPNGTPPVPDFVGVPAPEPRGWWINGWWVTWRQSSPTKLLTFIGWWAAHTVADLAIIHAGALLLDYPSPLAGPYAFLVTIGVMVGAGLFVRRWL